MHLQGVFVSTAEERRAGRVQQAMQQAESDSEKDVIAYVLVPADTTRPLQELTLEKQQQTVSAGDLLVEHLKPAFAKTSNNHFQVDISLLQKQAQETLVGSSGAPTTVSDEALRQVASEASVETFTLVHPTPSNQFTGINIYLDEVGMLKRLPINTRASQYAERAGFNPPPTFYGDVFLGRICHKPVVKNVTFCLGIDTAMDAPWLQSATTENLEYQMEKNKITGQQNERQPAIAGSDGKAKQENGFSWTQTEEELEVCVPLSNVENVQSKEVQVKFRPQSLQVQYQKKDLVSFTFFERIDVDSGTWTIDRSSGQLIITMEKMEQAFWPRIID